MHGIILAFSRAGERGDCMKVGKLRTQIADLQKVRAELSGIGRDDLVARVDDLIASAEEDLAELLAANQLLDGAGEA